MTDFKSMEKVGRTLVSPVTAICLTDFTAGGTKEGVTFPGDGEKHSTFSGDKAGASQDTKEVQRSCKGSCKQASTWAVIRRKQRRRSRAPERRFVVNCLRLALAFMYYTGLCSVKPKPLPKSFVCIQKIFLASLLSMSLLYTVSSAKTNWILFRAKPSKIRFLKFGVSMVAIITRLLCIKAFGGKTKSTNNLLKSIDALNSPEDNIDNDSTETKRTWIRALIIVVILVSTSILMTCCFVVFGEIPFKEWSFENQQLVQAYETSEFLFIWTSNNWENETDILDAKYGTNMTLAAASLAITGDTLTFVGSLHENLMVDFWAVVAMQLYASRQCLIEMIQDSNDLNFLDTDDWNYYLKHRKICEGISEIFGLLLVFVHIENTILMSYSLLTIFSKMEISVKFVIRIVNVVKVLITYSFLQKASDVNEELKETVLRKSKRRNKIVLNDEPISVCVLLEDMRSHPIGLGRGEYHVNDAFVAKIAGAVASIFIVLMDAIN